MYAGNERRKRQILITTNTKYYMAGRRCVAVRDCITGALRLDHEAIGSEVVARLCPTAAGSWRIQPGGAPDIGQRLFFASHVVTSPVRAVRRPDPTARHRAKRPTGTRAPR